MANFFPIFFFLPFSSFASNKLSKTIPTTTKTTPIKATILIDCFNIKKHNKAVIAPDVFSIGSDIDSSINLIPKNENVIEII